MRRILLLTLTTLSIAAGAMLGPSSALATDPTCTIHDLRITEWGIQDDHVNTSWDFKCGGATNSRWYVALSLQHQDSAGYWHTYDCENGNPCSVLRPGGVSGDYGGGEEHSGTNQWNPTTNIDCDTIRFHGQVTFTGQGFQNWNSLTIHIGGC